MPSPFPTSRITPPVGRAEASVATSRRQACSASRSEPGPSHSPRFSQPGATARKKSGPMLSYTRAAGFPPCLSTPAACRACWTVHPAIHAGRAAISHPRLSEASRQPGCLHRHWIHGNGSASRRRHNRACQKGHAHRSRQQPVFAARSLPLLVARSPGDPVPHHPASGIYVPPCGIPRAGHRASSQVRACPRPARTAAGKRDMDRQPRPPGPWRDGGTGGGWPGRIQRSCPACVPHGQHRRWAHCVAELVGGIAWCGRGWGS